jgi:hypothetical protein
VFIGGPRTDVARSVVSRHILIFWQRVDIIDLATFTDCFVAAFPDLAGIDFTDHGPVIISLLGFGIVPC